MNKKAGEWFGWILIFSGMVLIAAALSLSMGAAGIPVKRILPILLEGSGSAEYGILTEVRIPRILLGFAVGGALSLAGVILQGLFRNPLVEPYTLGISGGASLGVTLNLFLGLYKIGSLTLPLSGFLGALLIVMLVYLLSLRRAVLRLQGLLLTGVMISFIASSLTLLILAVSRAEDLHGILFWIMGSLDEPNRLLIDGMLGASVLFLLIAYLFCLDLNAFSLGEEEALHLGIRVERSKRILFVIASLATGFAVSAAGMIGFVGLVVPHLVRRAAGSDHRILLAGSFLAGGAFLMVCDAAARTVIAPLELPVGVITGILGGGLFLVMLMKGQDPKGGRRV